MEIRNIIKQEVKKMLQENVQLNEKNNFIIQNKK